MYGGGAPAVVDAAHANGIPDAKVYQGLISLPSIDGPNPEF